MTASSTIPQESLAQGVEKVNLGSVDDGMLGKENKGDSDDSDDGDVATVDQGGPGSKKKKKKKPKRKVSPIDAELDLLRM